MKLSKYFIPALLSPLMLVGCADYDDWSTNPGEKPATIAGYEYLNDYAPLKENLNRDASGSFLLGAGIDESEFNKKASLFRLASHNFDEIVAGNAMKMASCVKDNGEMDFSNVSTFLQSAEEAGLNVYGHTLAWHAQQPSKWLKSLLADKDLPVDPDASNNFLKITTPKATDVSYGWQIYYVLSEPLVKGKTYHLTMRAKTANSFKMGFWPYKDGGATQYLADPAVPNEWGTLSWDFTAADDLEQLQWAIGFLDGELDFDDVKLVEDGTDVNLVENGNFNEESTKGWRKNGWHGDLKFEIGHEGAGPQEFQVEVKRRCLEVVSADKKQDAWETQLWFVTDATFAEGDKWEVSFDCRANKNATASTQIHKEAGGTGYLFYVGIGEVPFTLKWQNFSASGNFTKEQAGGHSIAFNLNELAEGTEYYFDNISVKINGVEQIVNGDCEGTETKSYVAKEKNGTSAPGRIVDKYMETRQGNSIPLSDEEKKDTLTWAMDRWIKGMMEACEGKVKAWDVVNEAVSGGNPDAEGVYELQHESKDANDFFWQNYMGDLDYVRTAVKLARQYGPEDIKLFVNDYNLEYEWHGNDNKKLQSLIKWIERWEADGVTKIDGIGTQTHISFQADPDKQKKQEDLIKDSFKRMAATGKLVRVSELDMGYTDANGNKVTTDKMTEAMHKQMSDFYKFIVKAYFENVPAAQRYGICQWCITDAPSNSGWRPSEPVGLWKQDYSRKHTFAGFADGLSEATGKAAQ